MRVELSYAVQGGAGYIPKVPMPAVYGQTKRWWTLDIMGHFMRLTGIGYTSGWERQDSAGSLDWITKKRGFQLFTRHLNLAGDILFFFSSGMLSIRCAQSSNTEVRNGSTFSCVRLEIACASVFFRAEESGRTLTVLRVGQFSLCAGTSMKLSNKLRRCCRLLIDQTAHARILCCFATRPMPVTDIGALEQQLSSKDGAVTHSVYLLHFHSFIISFYFCLFSFLRSIGLVDKAWDTEDCVTPLSSLAAGFNFPRFMISWGFWSVRT